MGIEGFLASEDERAARNLVEKATLILHGTDGDVPQRFVAALYGHTSAEDLRSYDARELASLAQAAFRHLSLRKPGRPDVRITAPEPVPGGEQLGTLSVIEIVNDDMPFLLDSVTGELAEQGIAVRLVAHPILMVERDAGGNLLGLPVDASAGKAVRESFIHIHIDRIDADRSAALSATLGAVLEEVRAAVTDWQPMLAHVREILAEMRAAHPPLPQDEVAEAIALLEWLLADNFTFLGTRDYLFTGPDGGGELEPQFESGLGLLRTANVRLFSRGGQPMTMTPEIDAYLREPVSLIVTKSNTVSRVHRRVSLDVIGIKRFDAEGHLIGEYRIAGLFTSTAYSGSSSAIPYLRRKEQRVLARAGFDAGGHSGKALVSVLESYPRDDLFQIDDDLLYQFAMAILQLDERPRVRVLPRRERFDRFVSVLVYVPRDRYGSDVRQRIGVLLAEAYAGVVSSFRPLFLDGPLTRVHFMIDRLPGTAPEPDRAALEAAVTDVVRTWSDKLAGSLALVHPLDKVHALEKRYAHAFSAGYRATYSPETALADIRVIEGLTAEKPIAIDFYRRKAAATVGLKVLSRGRPLPLSERVPVLEAMGFVVVDERTNTIEPVGDNTTSVFLHDMLLARRGGGEIPLETLGSRLEACLLAVLRGEAESDGFNALVLGAGLPWRDVALLRTLARYLRQVGLPYSQDYMWATLNGYPVLAEQLVSLFHTRFSPAFTDAGDARSSAEAAIRATIETALEQVSSLDDDRILRHFANLIEVALRTSFYQKDADGNAKASIAIKFESGKVEGLPLPHPLFEIFVYSPRVEGVHLRFGRVARGGLRWSDRAQDFRTEVLGLVKAQQVKNAVIVPVGAKGGFVPKHLPAGPREAIQAEGTEAYRLFVGSLLDITDDLDGADVVHPVDVVRHDADDPYLVVAADKGTATFSDTANAISQGRGFWLDDAFASGGSVGYDHKKMGITARGAWEAVRRHFREMDLDIRTTAFTVAGVGDMSGDVFGNGMLLEHTIKLVAAFDHRDIFLDPAPDTEKAWAERNRLFALPRSSWQDYDKALISEGGGVFPRAAKSIPLSEPVRALLGIDKAEATPAEVMNAILKAQVDLLWFGGIGTYVRAASETDAQAGDRANDAIRITGGEVRARVIGEGANLGVTQRGRIEAARAGVRLNTDAIDNSAGVNTSDVEVNIKIALGTPLRDGRLDGDARVALLASMTDDVGVSVLRNNYLQTLALSLAEQRGVEDLGFEQRLIQSLEARGLLNRAVEYLPTDAEIMEMRGRGEGLTRPELAVLLAYAKLTLHADLLDCGIPDDPYLARELARYFPKQLRKQFPDAVETHRLRRDIIATQLSNSVINAGGPAFVVRLADETGAGVSSIAKAYAVARDAFGVSALNREIHALDAQVPGAVQLELYRAVQDLLLDRTVWFLRNVDLKHSLDDLVGHYAAGVEAASGALAAAIPEEFRAGFEARVVGFVEEGVPEALARHVCKLRALAAATDLVLIADRSKASVGDVAATYFAVGLHFRLDQLSGPARAIPAPDYYDRLALDRSLGAFEIAVRRITTGIITHYGVGADAVESWIAAHSTEVERTRSAIHEIVGSGLSLSKLAVAASLLGDLARD